MSIPFSGVIRRSRGIMGAIAVELRQLSMKPVNKITVQFDPFYENVQQTRNFLYYISANKILKSNLSCILKTSIVCDRSEPTVTCDLANGGKVLFKCENLDALDILRLYNKHITPIAPLDPEPDTRKPKKLKKLRRKVRISRSRR